MSISVFHLPIHHLSWHLPSSASIENGLAEEHAHARSRLGLCRQTETTRQSLPDAPRSGARGHPVPDREHQLARAVASHDVKASGVSIWRWNHRILPFSVTGKKERECVTGMSQLLVVVYISIWLTALHDETAEFVCREGVGSHNNPAMSKPMKDLEITRVKASKETFQAFLPVNLQKEVWFWSQPPPVGAAGVRRR